MKLLAPACGLPHWFPVDSPWLPYPMQYEMTAVSKLFGLPYVPRVRLSNPYQEPDLEPWEREALPDAGTYPYGSVRLIEPEMRDGKFHLRTYVKERWAVKGWLWRNAAQVRARS